MDRHRSKSSSSLSSAPTNSPLQQVQPMDAETGHADDEMEVDDGEHVSAAQPLSGPVVEEEEIEQAMQTCKCMVLSLYAPSLTLCTAEFSI